MLGFVAHVSELTGCCCAEKGQERLCHILYTSPQEKRVNAHLGDAEVLDCQCLEADFWTGSLSMFTCFRQASTHLGSLTHFLGCGNNANWCQWLSSAENFWRSCWNRHSFSWLWWDWSLWIQNWPRQAATIVGCKLSKASSICKGLGWRADGSVRAHLQCHWGTRGNQDPFLSFQVCSFSYWCIAAMIFSLKDW